MGTTKKFKREGSNMKNWTSITKASEQCARPVIMLHEADRIAFAADAAIAEAQRAIGAGEARACELVDAAADAGARRDAFIRELEQQVAKASGRWPDDMLRAYRKGIRPDDL